MKPVKEQLHVGAAGYPVAVEALPERRPFKLTKEMVLLAAKRAVSPDSAYINDEVQKMHRDHVYGGGKSFPPRTSLVLARLNALAADGVLEKSRFTNGYYGYRWTITEASRKALQDSSVEGKQGDGDGN